MRLLFIVFDFWSLFWLILAEGHHVRPKALTSLCSRLFNVLLSSASLVSTVKRSLQFLICILCQAGMFAGRNAGLKWRQSSAVCWGRKCCKNIGVGFSMNWLRSDEGKTSLGEILTLSSLYGLSTKPSVGTGVEIMRRESALQPDSLVTVLFWFYQGSSYFC